MPYVCRMPLYREGYGLWEASGDDIIAVLSYMKSRWPDDGRARHDEMEARIGAQLRREIEMTTKAIMLGGAITLAVTASAFAHSKQETTVPEDGGRVLQLEEVVMRFDKPMRVTRVVLSGPEGDVSLSSEMGTDAVTEYVATPEGDVPQGDYEVEWRGLSVDGHPMQGRYSFTVGQ